MKETSQNFYTCTTFSHYSNILSKYVFTIDFNFFVHFREPRRHRNRRAIECSLAEAKAGIVRRKEKNTNKRATETHYCANQEGHVRNLPVDCRSLTPLCLGGLERQQRYAIHALDTACGCPGWTEKNKGSIVSRARCWPFKVSPTNRLNFTLQQAKLPTRNFVHAL